MTFEKESLNKWNLITIDDPALMPGKTVKDLITLIRRNIPYEFVILNDIVGAGKNGLIKTYQENENTVILLNQEFLDTLCEVSCFEWGDFFLFLSNPGDWEIDSPAYYPNIIKFTDTTIRAIDNQYLYIYTPYQEIVDLIKQNYNIESHKIDFLENLEYPY